MLAHCTQTVEHLRGPVRKQSRLLFQSIMGSRGCRWSPWTLARHTTPLWTPQIGRNLLERVTPSLNIRKRRIQDKLYFSYTTLCEDSTHSQVNSYPREYCIFILSTPYPFSSYLSHNLSIKVPHYNTTPLLNFCVQVSRLASTWHLRRPYLGININNQRHLWVMS